MTTKYSKMKGDTALRERLPKSAIATLAKKYNKSWTWIYNVVVGKHLGQPGIIEDAIELAKIEDKRRREIEKVFQRNFDESNLINGI